MPDDLTSALDQIREAEHAASPGPWTIAEKHGRDISDEGWSSVGITDADGKPVALTYLTDLIETDGDGENERFIVTARTAMPLLLAAIEAVLKPHEPIQIYESAEGCDHPRPEEGTDEWDAWMDDHPHGEGLDDSDSVQICLLTPRHKACPACSELVYDTWGDDDGFIDASDCIVRPLITREPTKGEGGDGS